MGFRNVKDGVYGLQLRHYRENGLGHGQMATKTRSQMIERSSLVMPTMACAVAGIYGCGIQESAHLNMKTRHCISG